MRKLPFLLFFILPIFTALSVAETRDPNSKVMKDSEMMMKDSKMMKKDSKMKMMAKDSKMKMKDSKMMKKDSKMKMMAKDSKMKMMKDSKMMMVQVSVPGIYCEKCVKGMRKAFKDSVSNPEKDVQVNLDTKIVSLNLSSNLSDADIRKRIKDAGYNIKKITR